VGKGNDTTGQNADGTTTITGTTADGGGFEQTSIIGDLFFNEATNQ
jgi:hypothetical protein